MSSLQKTLVTAVVTLVVGSFSATSSAAVLRQAHGTYVTNLNTGTIDFVTVKAVRLVNITAFQGNFRINGRGYPGIMYPTPTGVWVMTWYFGYSGIPAGQATVTLQPDNTLTGPIYFYNRSGATIEQGTTTIRLQY